MSIAGRIGGQRLPTDYVQPTMPRMGAGALTPNVLNNRGGARAAGVLSPNSPGYDNLNQQVADIFGRTSDLPPDSPFSDYLISIGYGDANPSAFPERNLRRDLRRSSLETAAGAINGTGGGAGGNTGPLPPTAPRFPGSGGGMPGPVDTSRLRNLAIPEVRELTTMPRIDKPNMPGKVGSMDASGLKPPPGFAPPQADADPLVDLYTRFMRNSQNNGRMRT